MKRKLLRSLAVLALLGAMTACSAVSLPAETPTPEPTTIPTAAVDTKTRPTSSPTTPTSMTTPTSIEVLPQEPSTWPATEPLPELEPGITLTIEPERRYIYFDGQFGGYWDGDWHSVNEPGIKPYDRGNVTMRIKLDHLIAQEGYVVYRAGELMGTTRVLGIGDGYMGFESFEIDIAEEDYSSEWQNEYQGIMTRLYEENCTKYYPLGTDRATSSYGIFGITLPATLETGLKNRIYDATYNGAAYPLYDSPKWEYTSRLHITVAINAADDIGCPTLCELELSDAPAAVTTWMLERYGEMSDVTQVVRADLDSDGELEYIVVIDTPAEVDGVFTQGPYSYFMVLMVDGEAVTPLIEDRTGPFEAANDRSEIALERYRTPSVTGVYDFNSDGIFEICVRYQFWEWSSQHIFSDGVEVIRTQSGM